MKQVRAFYVGMAVAWLPQERWSREAEMWSRPAGLPIHRFFIIRPIFFLAMLVAATSNLIWSDQSKIEAGRPKWGRSAWDFLPSLGSTTIVWWMMSSCSSKAVCRRLDVSSCERWALLWSKHVTSSSIPPLVLTTIQLLALILFVFVCKQVKVQPWIIRPTSSGHFGSQLEGHMRPKLG